MSTLAEKWSPKVSQVLTQKSVVAGLTNHDYDFNPGFGSINIQTYPTANLNTYDPNGGSQRIGQAQNLETTVQTFTLEETISFNGIIDSVENSKNLRILTPARFLKNQLDVKIVPYTDTYVIGVMTAAANAAGNDAIVTAGATTKDTAWSTFLSLRGFSIDHNGPQSGYRAVCTSAYYNFLKQSGFVTESDLGQKIKSTGFLGNVDGTPIKIAQSDRLGANVDIVITHPMATTYAMHLKQFDTFDKLWNIGGKGVQGVELFDAFVDANKVQLITVHKTA